MSDLIKLYLFALRAGDRPLAAALGRTLGGDAALRDAADQALQRLPRGPSRRTAGAARVVNRLASTLA
jgi:hypothetical protein